MRKAISTILAAVCAFAAIGCGGSGSTVLGIDSNPRIRTVNAISNPGSVTILVDTQEIKRFSEAGFISDYTVFTNGNHNIHFNDATTSAELIDTSQLLELNNYYTAIGYRQLDGTHRLLMLSDKPTSTAGSNGQIRVVNASRGTYDVYVTTPGADITGSAPTRSDVQIGKNDEPYTTVDLGGSASKTFQVRITEPGTKVPVATTNVTLASREAATVVITFDETNTSLLTLPAKVY